MFQLQWLASFPPINLSLSSGQKPVALTLILHMSRAQPVFLDPVATPPLKSAELLVSRRIGMLRWTEKSLTVMNFAIWMSSWEIRFVLLFIFFISFLKGILILILVLDLTP